MEDGFFLFCTIFFSVLACCVIPFSSPSKKSTLAVLFVAFNAFVTSLLAVQALTDHPIEFMLSGGEVFGDIPLRIDSLSAWFILIINLTCVNGALYGIRYMKPYEGQTNNTSLHWSIFVIMQTSMLWVCSLQHGLAFLVAWEIMSIAAFLLAMFEHSHVVTLKAGINYLIQTHIGATCLTIAFIWISSTVGSYDFVSIQSFFNTSDSNWVFWLFLAGFGMKAGFILLHTWVPHADPAAPSHISGVMSGVLVKMGIYGIIRMITYMNNGLVMIGEIILVISVTTAFYGILSAAIHRDFRRMLAFCTIENIGVIGMGIGIGLIGKGIGDTEIMLLGFAAALLHTLNHSLYKSLLFFVSGNIYHLTHTRNMEHLGGLIKTIPISAFFFLSGSLAIGGLPPFNGFVSKFLLYSSLFEGIKVESFQLNIIMIGCIAVLAIVGGISVLTFTKSFSVMFLGIPRFKHKRYSREKLSWAHLPLFIALLSMLAIGLFPSMMRVPMQRIIYVIAPGLALTNTFDTINPTMSNVSAASLLLIVLIAFVYLLRHLISTNRATIYSPTWVGGYTARNSRMQYTGKSFSKTLAKLFAFVTGEQKKYSEIERTDIFPSHRDYQSTYAEFFEKNIINRLSSQLLHLMNYFSFIHNGKIQMYVLYGFIFILISIVATFFNIL